METDFLKRFREVIDRTVDTGQRENLESIYGLLAVLISLTDPFVKRDDERLHNLTTHIDEQDEAVIEAAKAAGIPEPRTPDLTTDTTIANMRLKAEEMKEDATYQDREFFDELDAWLEMFDEIGGEFGKFLSRPKNQSEGNPPERKD